MDSKEGITSTYKTVIFHKRRCYPWNQRRFPGNWGLTRARFPILTICPWAGFMVVTPVSSAQQELIVLMWLVSQTVVIRVIHAHHVTHVSTHVITHVITHVQHVTHFVQTSLAELFAAPTRFVPEPVKWMTHRTGAWKLNNPGTGPVSLAFFLLCSLRAFVSSWFHKQCWQKTPYVISLKHNDYRRTHQTNHR